MFRIANSNPFLIKNAMLTGESEAMMLDIKLYQAFSEGFLQKTLTVLTPAEIEYLPFSSKLLTFIMGLRFLTDYINGDTYYKTAYAEHNLIRARAQFQLLRSMEKQFDTMCTISDNICRNLQ